MVSLDPAGRKAPADDWSRVLSGRFRATARFRICVTAITRAADKALAPQETTRPEGTGRVKQIGAGEGGAYAPIAGCLVVVDVAADLTVADEVAPSVVLGDPAAAVSAFDVNGGLAGRINRAGNNPCSEQTQAQTPAAATGPRLGSAVRAWRQSREQKEQQQTWSWCSWGSPVWSCGPESPC